MPTRMGDLMDHPYDLRTHDKGADLIDQQTYLGVEIECEGINGGASESFPRVSESPYWRTAHDDSLRGRSLELKFAMPLSGSDAETALKAVELDVLDAGFPLKSDRTSTHIHIDVNKLEPPELYRFLILSIILERVLYRYAGTHRERSIFCVPFYKADGLIHVLSCLVEDMNNIRSKIRRISDERFRYSGINLNALAKFGTVEFRMLDAEFMYDKLILWINALLAIKKYAVTMQGSILELNKYLSARGPETLLKDVLGDMADEFSYPEATLDILRGIRTAQLVDHHENNVTLVWELPRIAKESTLKFNYEDTHKKKFFRAAGNEGEKKKVPGWPENFWAEAPAAARPPWIVSDEVEEDYDPEIPF